VAETVMRVATDPELKRQLVKYQQTRVRRIESMRRDTVLLDAMYELASE